MNSQNTTEYIYDAEVIRVIDGDTIEFLVDLGFGIHFKIKARLHGINTPETRTRDKEEKIAGIKAKFQTKLWCRRNKKNLLVEAHNGKRIKQGKYGRWLVVVKNKDGESLNQFLLDNDFAKKVDY